MITAASVVSLPVPAVVGTASEPDDTVTSTGLVEFKRFFYISGSRVGNGLIIDGIGDTGFTEVFFQSFC